MARTNATRLPSGDQRGPVSRMPDVSRRGASSPLAGTAEIDDSYRFSFSFTATRPHATVEPSGDSCGSAIHVNLKRSFSVMKRLLCARGAATSTSAQATTATETRRTMTELLWITRYYQPDMSIRDLVIVGAGP